MRLVQKDTNEDRRQKTYVERRLAALLDGGQPLVVDVGLQKLLQFAQTVGDPRHQVVHPAQVYGQKQKRESLSGLRLDLNT